MKTSLNVVEGTTIMSMEAEDSYDKELLTRLEMKYREGRGPKEIIRHLDLQKASFHHG